MGQVVAKAWSDENFKRTLLAQPTATLRAAGLTIPAGWRCGSSRTPIRSSTWRCRQTETGELSDAQLENIAGGQGGACVGKYCGWI